MTIQEAIEEATTKLNRAGIQSPKLKARLIMQFILDKTRQYIIVNDLLKLEEKQEEQYFNEIDKIEKGYPIEHITHQKEFMKLSFFVDENVLIPRQDTEILVEEVIEISKKINSKKILDLCTGSGAIGVSLAKYLPNCEITAVDISKKALQIAKKNAIINEVEKQITFISSDLFSNLESQKFDIIVSNPPYIKRNDIENLEEQVKKEPLIALDGGEDGLDFYKKIIKEAHKYLVSEGYLCLEIGYNQKDEVIKLIEKEETFKNIYSKKDLYGIDRIIIAEMK